MIANRDNTSIATQRGEQQTKNKKKKKKKKNAKTTKKKKKQIFSVDPTPKHSAQSSESSCDNDKRQ
jgi:hypothetical protein